MTRVEGIRATERLAEKLKYFENTITEKVENRFFRLEVAVEKCDVVKWLQAQDDPIKTYWRDRSGQFEMAGLGQADIVSGSLMPNYDALFIRLNTYLENTDGPVRYYGGLRFNKRNKADSKWQSFASYRFIVPKFELFRSTDGVHLACNILIRDEEPQKVVAQALTELKELRFGSFSKMENSFEVIERSDFPNFEGWKSNINHALTAFKENRLQKIVLARRSSFKLQSKVDPIELLWRLKLNNHRAYYFCFQTKQDVAFVGGTPEQLYLRDGDKLFTEAVAGTRKRGESSSADFALEQDLLNCEKDIREHRFVVDSIRNSLRTLTTNLIEQEQVSVLKLSRLQHLLMTFSGIIKPGVKDSDILDNLHPTPAVGGVPSEKAIDTIDEVEQFDRGWYAGPVGWIAKNRSEFAVAIRSGLVQEDNLYLYSGAGIVEGSNPESEWEEIENKIAGFINTFNSKIKEKARVP